MIEVLSIMAFHNPKRISYLEKSLGSFYQHYNQNQVRHIVMDGSPSLGEQKEIFESFGIEYYHRPISFRDRMAEGINHLKTDYFVFLPDDFQWIFEFPLEDAVQQCREHQIDELKLTARGMSWYAQKNSEPTPWHNKGEVISGEKLKEKHDLFISQRHFRRDFHEQFSLACNLIRKDFMQWILDRVPAAVSPGDLEKKAYLRLLLHRYKTAYYKMWIPAFHFIDKNVEGENQWFKANDMLIEDNIKVYNQLFNT
ncbi:MAG: hypothetical protein AB8C84_09805 [Oligoflexales bacterium]